MFQESLRRLVISVCILPSSGLFLSAPAATSQGLTLGESVYKSVSEAVFLVECLNESGQASSLGTAFLVADQRLITNYHVVEACKPHLRVGTLRIECTVEKSDRSNDLVLLRVPASISAKPLVLSEAEPAAGATIFAVGNPAGLERTITQGLVSGRREVDGQSLLQISAAISPGSSGGPVVNALGEVVGVAVGYLRDGQNLNFAVPAKAVVDLLRGDPGSVPTLEELLSRIEQLEKEMEGIDFSDERWQQKSEEINSLLERAKSVAAGSPDKLLSVAAVADRNFRCETAIELARAVLVSAPGDLRARRILARNLLFGDLLAEKEDRQKQLAEALVHAKAVVESSRKPTADDLFILALILEDMPSREEEAFNRFQQALVAARAEKEVDLLKYLRGLFRTSKDLKQAGIWFKEIVENGGAGSYDWELLAARSSSEGEYKLAADAWAKAAAFEATSTRLCRAGLNYWLSEQLDEALSYYRKCVEIGAAEEGSEGMLGKAYASMSDILFVRGVYDQSISYAKQSIALSPEDPWPYYNLSRSLNALGRNGEAVTAAETAIRLSDGKFSQMHFALGSAYFDMENWDRAGRAFQKSAELAPDDWASAYNVALCFLRQRFYKDAATWYEEVLRRKPDHTERDEILKTIRTLRE